MSEEIKALKEELAATKKLLRSEMARSEEAIDLARDMLKDLKRVNNEIAMLRIRGKYSLKVQ
jgi:hypothetical protein